MRLMNSAGTVLALEDGTSTNDIPTVGTAITVSPIYAYRIPTTGTYYVGVQSNSGTGAYALDAAAGERVLAA